MNADMVVDLLQARRETMFLVLDVCLSSVLNETFLAVGNEEAFRVSLFSGLKSMALCGGSVDLG